MTIGTESSTQSSCQPGNRHAGTSASRIVRSQSGTLSSAETASLRRSESMRSLVARRDHSSSPGVWSAALYPARSTASIPAAVSPPSPTTVARSVAKFTLAVTPSSLPSLRSIRVAQAEQVMPAMSSSTTSSIVRTVGWSVSVVTSTSVASRASLRIVESPGSTGCRR